MRSEKQPDLSELHPLERGRERERYTNLPEGAKFVYTSTTSRLSYWVSNPAIGLRCSSKIRAIWVKMLLHMRGLSVMQEHRIFMLQLSVKCCCIFWVLLCCMISDKFYQIYVPYIIINVGTHKGNEYDAGTYDYVTGVTWAFSESALTEASLPMAPISISSKFIVSFPPCSDRKSVV